MNESSNNISRVASNMTEIEFDGYCKGMGLHWFFKAVDKKEKNQDINKRVKFWELAFDRYKSYCKGVDNEFD